jgi:hypothetical protein
MNPTRVTFEQAKWLKEKGFNVSLYHFYYQDKPNSKPYITTGTEYQSDRNCKWDWNLNGGESGNQSKIIPYPNKDTGIYYSAPEQWQVVEWLRVNHGIWVWVRPYKDHAADNNDPIQHQMNIYKSGVSVYKEFNSHDKAYSAAFDYIKDNNLI